MKRAEAKITTIIGKDAVLEGDFMASGSIRLDGCVEGNVKVSGICIVGAAGKIHGNLEAYSTIIGGEVLGNVTVEERTELTGTARLIGDIRTNLIVIDEKAIFQGRCDMNQDETKIRKRPPRENRAAKKSAKDALKEALQEMEEETKAAEADLVAASNEISENDNEAI